MADRSRLSLNQITTDRWSVGEAVEGCVRHGIPSIALWRHKIKDAGLASCVRLVKDAQSARFQRLPRRNVPCTHRAGTKKES